jgi:hypothetical protein
MFFITYIYIIQSFSKHVILQFDTEINNHGAVHSTKQKPKSHPPIGRKAII